MGLFMKKYILYAIMYENKGGVMIGYKKTSVSEAYYFLN